MYGFLTRRLLLLIPAIWGTATLTFILMHMIPGDPALTYLGDRATPAAIEALRHQWGLDQSLALQYVDFLKGIVVGDFGNSLFFHAPISSLLTIRLPPTLLLMFMGALFSVIISVPIAILTVGKNSKAVDISVRSFNAVAQGAPVFFIATILISLFSIHYRIFPASGYGDTIKEHMVSGVLPALSIAMGIMPILIRSLRSSLIDAMNSDYISFARAKGLDRYTIWMHYALRNAAISGISVLSIQIGALAGGTLVVENVFNIPGMGSFMMQGILNRDFPVVQASAMIFAFMVILVYLLADIIYGLVDPRVRVK